jgi:sigma-B regulation protein RsbU (phosphoserine phosphatase)
MGRAANYNRKPRARPVYGRGKNARDCTVRFGLPILLLNLTLVTDMDVIEQDHLRLTDFMDLPTLQEIQDSFAAVANVKATITDEQGRILTQPNPTTEFLRKQRAIADAEEQQGPRQEGAEYVAPIMVNEHRLGTIRMSVNGSAGMIDESKLEGLSQKLGIDGRRLKAAATQLLRQKSSRPAAIQFLYLLANAIARLCYQEYQLRQRINELTAVYNVTAILSESRDLNKMLQRTVQIVAEVMGVKASSIRLINRDDDELITKAVYNLSDAYLNKGPMRLSAAIVDRTALSSKGYEYVGDMANDPRVLFPQDAAREGVVSTLAVGMRYKGRPVGVLRVYTAEKQTFPQHRIDLMKAIAAQAAAAIENTRLIAEAIQAEALEKQVRMAADVQQRMIPQKPPELPNLELASVYVPCYELGGDFYDFIPLPDDNVALVVADVSGKGVPASLIMASVRAFLRAEVDNVYYLYEIMRRINLMLCRDTKPSEFVTLFYGVLNARTRRLTYCNAGHPPALLLRGGTLMELHGENTVLGINPDEDWKQSIVDLKKDDLLLMYTDGLPDAMNFQKETFGRQRVLEAFQKGGKTADLAAQNLLWEMRRFVGLTKRTDDVTMIAARMT